jgi:hypothetical protein
LLPNGKKRYPPSTDFNSFATQMRH